MKPERYKVKSISEVAQSQKENDIMRSLNQIKDKRIMIETQKIKNILDNILNEKIIKDKTKRTAQITTLSSVTVKNIEALLGEKLESDKVFLSYDKIRHAVRNNKPKSKKANEQDLLNILNLINFKKHFYYDPQNKNMLLFFNTFEPSNNALYMAITPNYNTKENGRSNQIVTISKFSKNDFKSRIKTLIKLRG